MKYKLWTYNNSEDKIMFDYEIEKKWNYNF